MFFKEAIKNLDTIGALTPLSNRCVTTFLNTHDRNTVDQVVELGGGTGVFSKQIVKQLHSSAQLTTYELNASFQSCYASLPTENFTLRIGCASSLTTHHASESVDIVLCTIPFTFLENELATSIVTKSQQVLKPWGTFCLFQYSPLKQAFFEETLSECRLEKKERIFRNFPPALFFVFRKY